MRLGKIIKIAVIILIVLIIAVVALMLFFRKNRENYIVDGPGMINTLEGEVEAVSYSSAGGMEGDSTWYKLTRLENGCSRFEYEIITHNGADPVAGVVELEYDAFETIRQYCRDTSCLLLCDTMGKPSELMLLDAPINKVIFTMEDEWDIVFRSDYDYPEQFCNVIGYVCMELEKCLPEDVAEMVK